MVYDIQKVRTTDPAGYVKGVIEMYEVTDAFDVFCEPISTHYTERDAEDALLQLIT